MSEPEAPTKIGKFDLNWRNKLEIAIDGQSDPAKADSAKWAPLAAGINNITPAGNDTATNDQYYDGEGFGSADVTSKRFQLTIAGHRLAGDLAQDFVASKSLAIGDDLKTLCRFTLSNGDVIMGQITMQTIVATGGQPGAKQTFSFVAVFNGKPTYTVKAAPSSVGAG